MNQFIRPMVLIMKHKYSCCSKSWCNSSR